MKRTLTIAGRSVTLDANAALPRLYRKQIGREIFSDMQQVAEAMRTKLKGGSEIPLEALNVFEDIAYCMAMAADPENTPDTPETWLEQFPMFSIYQVFPEIEALWIENLQEINEPAKK